MDKIAGLILALGVVYLIILVVVWIAMWIGAICVFLFQAILEPFVIYLLPAIIAIGFTIGLYGGSYISAKNYYMSMKKNINPLGRLKNFVKYYLIILLSLFLIVNYILFAGVSSVFVYKSSAQFIIHVHDHYDSIHFPAYKIEFPPF